MTDLEKWLGLPENITLTAINRRSWGWMVSLSSINHVTGWAVAENVLEATVLAVLAVERNSAAIAERLARQPELPFGDLGVEI